MKENVTNKSESNLEIPEIQDMIMGMTNTEVRHRVIHSQFSNRLSDGSTILKIECVRLHSFHIALFAKCLNLQLIAIELFRIETLLEKLNKCTQVLRKSTNSISSFGITSISSSNPLSVSSNIDLLGVSNLFLISIASCSIN